MFITTTDFGQFTGTEKLHIDSRREFNKVGWRFAESLCETAGNWSYGYVWPERYGEAIEVDLAGLCLTAKQWTDLQICERCVEVHNWRLSEYAAKLLGTNHHHRDPRKKRAR